MAKPGIRRARDAAGVLAWLDGRVDFERTPPRGPSSAAFGIARMRRLLSLVGDPHRRFAVVHVAGTKGKGSTVAMLAAILDAAGHRTGRYLSPHVHSLGERICVGGEPITDRDLVAACDLVRPAVETLDRGGATPGSPTWFEIVTALAFVHFARAGVGIAVLETGLGGRLDATNVCRPLVSVITSISLDHMELLGRTIGRIAAEKAGIIKRGRPVVSGAAQPAARRVIAAVARRRRARLVQAGRDFTHDHEPAATVARPLAPGHVTIRTAGGPPVRYRLGMVGRHQAENAALAVMAAREAEAAGFALGEAAIRRGLARARLPARIETLPGRPLVVVDAAHNVASIESLLETVAPVAAGRRRVLLFAASREKQIEEMLAAARGGFDEVVVTRYASNPRAAPIERLEAACRAGGLAPPHVADSPAAALATARRLAGPRGVVVAAGSFFLAAEVLAAAGVTGRR